MSGVKFSQRLCVDQAHTASISGVKFHPSGGLLASCSADNTVKVWHGTTGSPLATLQGHTQGVSDVAWTPDGSYLASASDDTTIRVWDAATVSVPFFLSNPLSPVWMGFSSSFFSYLLPVNYPSPSFS